MTIKSKIRTIKNYPIDGVMFRDITTLLDDSDGFKEAVDEFFKRYKDLKIDKIVAIEARGFIIGAPLAYLLNVGLVLIRKPGKLPSKTIEQEYQLEYGTDKIEIHTDAIKKGDKVLIVDDLIASGGTAEAAVRLVEKMEAEILECCFVIDLPDIGGRKRLINMGQKVFTLCEFEGE
jgi:adenine phosphoribosyltransferase